MLLSAIIDFSCGLIIEGGKRKLGLTISIITNLSFLFFFKYFNFAFENYNAAIRMLGLDNATWHNIPNITLPIGISFYTFQTLSYTIDVYRGTVKANRNFINFATYVTMFPQLVAGPIVRYVDINKQLVSKNISIDDFSEGIERFIIGLAKKVLIANTFATIADGIFALDVATISTPFVWLGIIAYSFQIYFDFSGYSDMAIGLGRMFGFRFLENFNYPYISRSIKEFWRRWHISLSSWFRDYLYIPLGGSRVGKKRLYLNLFIVFFVTGLWHGASWNFIVWGLFHGLFIVIERIGLEEKLSKCWKPLQHLYTLLVVLVGWVFFRAETLSNAISYIQRMFIPSSGLISVDSYIDFMYINSHTGLYFILAVICSTPIYRFFDEKLQTYQGTIIRTIALFALFVLSVIHLGAGSYNPFIYFRF
ncbi:MBOAT family O-acyltransferase [Aureispira sp. CCB-E]|nr:MBOAT family O-acyltransferase [Aureispira sp. CCB-E]WMX15396.1 MBOAT family O-acyltransferase [Aureispira sp. CCB-E]